MISRKEKQLIFETIELPALIKNEKVPTLASPHKRGKERILFDRKGDVFEMHKEIYDILEKHALLNDIINYLAKETKYTSILLCDDKGPKFSVKLNKELEE